MSAKDRKTIQETSAPKRSCVLMIRPVQPSASSHTRYTDLYKHPRHRCHKRAEKQNRPNPQASRHKNQGDCLYLDSLGQSAPSSVSFVQSSRIANWLIAQVPDEEFYATRSVDSDHGCYTVRKLWKRKWKILTELESNTAQHDMTTLERLVVIYKRKNGRQWSSLSPRLCL